MNMGLERLTAGLTVGYILLIPLGWSPFPWNIQWSDVVFVGLLGCLMTGRERARRWVRPLDAGVVLYLLGSLLSLATHGAEWRSLIECAKHLSGALVYFTLSFTGSQRELSARIVRTFSLAAGALAGLGVSAMVAHALWGVTIPRIGSVMALPYVGEVFRVRATFSSWEFFGEFLTFVTPMVIGFSMESVSIHVRRWAKLAVVLVAVAAFGTVSRSLAGWLIAGLVYLWPAWSKGWRRLLRSSLAGVALALVMGVQLASTVLIRDVHYSLDTNPAIPAPTDGLAFQDPEAGAERMTVAVSYNPISYSLLHAIALRAFRREPLTGIGLDRFHEETDRAYREGTIQEACRFMDPHSTWLGRLAETGLVGGVSLAVLWVGALMCGARLLRQPEHGQEEWMARAALAGLTGLLVNSLHVDLMNFRFLWVGLALVAGRLRG